MGGQTGRTSEPNNSSTPGHSADGPTPRANGSNGSNGQRSNAAPDPSPTAKYLDRSVDLENLRIPFARFPGIKGIVPEREAVCLGWSEIVQEIAPDPAPVFDRKDKVPYYIT